MLKIAWNERVKVEAMNTKDIRVGTLFTGVIGGYPFSLFLRIYKGVVDLKNHDRVWTQRDIDYPYVTDYQEVNGTLTVEDV